MRVPAGVRRRLRAAAWSWLPYLGVATGLFVTTTIFGVAVGVEDATSTTVPVDAQGGHSLPDVGSWYFLSHNGLVALKMASGFLLGGLPTVFILGYNGFVLGGTVVDAAARLGPLVTVGLLVPHGIFELPAIWLSGAIGLRWTHVLWCVASGSNHRPVPLHVRETLTALVLALVLLAVAAVVEAEVTFRLARVVT